MGCIAGLVENIADSVCRDPSFVGCNSSTLNLGTVSFTSGSEITIVGDNISQIWSRPVTATGCNKTTFNGGTSENINADCRNNPGYPGDLFTGCAVLKYASQICPYPWRVPTANDYSKLVQALGGAMYEKNEKFIKDMMVGVWAGVTAGECGNNQIPYGHDSMLYRTQSMHSGTIYTFKVHGAVTWPESAWTISFVGSPWLAMSVRCVRDN
jgi:uncharacterized protein (TIGR02145 family)